MYSILICDDDAFILEQIVCLTKKYLDGERTPYRLAVFENSRFLLSYLKKQESYVCSILFMDISLGEDNGIAVAKAIRRDFPKICIIFVSGYLNQLQDSFAVDPIFYLVKPIQENYFRDALQKAMDSFSPQESPSFTLSTKTGIYHIRAGEILYVESNKRTLIIHSQEETITTYEKLGDLQAQLPDYFIRTHKSYLVNMHYIRRMDRTDVMLTDGTAVPVSQSRHRETKESFLRFLGQQL